MAAQSQKDYIEDREREEYPKAQRENGVFTLPWAGEHPSFQKALKWFMTSKNNSNVPGSTLSNFYRLDKEVQYVTCLECCLVNSILILTTSTVVIFPVELLRGYW